jgi:hypothetical protein
MALALARCFCLHKLLDLVLVADAPDPDADKQQRLLLGCPSLARQRLGDVIKDDKRVVSLVVLARRRGRKALETLIQITQSASARFGRFLLSCGDQQRVLWTQPTRQPSMEMQRVEMAERGKQTNRLVHIPNTNNHGLWPYITGRLRKQQHHAEGEDRLTK